MTKSRVNFILDKIILLMMAIREELKFYYLNIYIYDMRYEYYMIKL